MNYMGLFSEDRSVERPAVRLFESMGWEVVNGYHERLGPEGTLGRDNQGEVFLRRRLQPALERLNPDLPSEAIDQAIEILCRDRSTLEQVRANQELHQLLRDGVDVLIRSEDGTRIPELVKIIDWREPTANDFLLVQQLWVTGDMYRRRADLVGFINGIPLVFVELKASHKRLRNAFDDNISDYRDTIPKIFEPNGFIICSNGSESRIGTITADWEHFSIWKRVAHETEPSRLSLETIIRGTCDPARLLDLLECFTVYMQRTGRTLKVLAKNHQYLGVNAVVERLSTLSAEERRKLGVFWHTQGSGKTLSMAFFAQKILRTQPGNWTFVIVTDRSDLDDQAYREFQASGIVTERNVQATSGLHLKQLLAGDHRFVFTLVQKFRTERRGERYPLLSEREDIVVLTDEAHRTQYDIFALNMRTALPNASFLGFTGTPLMAGEEHTKKEFGPYVSQYDFGESIEDGATVPLYYENRIPELQLEDPEVFDDEFQQILEDSELDETQERKLAQHFGKEYHLITRSERLDLIAEDLIDHFLTRGFLGKAMVVSIDKATAIQMYNRVRTLWDARIENNRIQLGSAAGGDDAAREVLIQEIRLLESTDMAVVVSQTQNEIRDMSGRGLDIRPHRLRMQTEDLEERFKDPSDSLGLVFLCAMWTTGFDVPSCSTIYLDKPMKNHTLMQTIARANRVFPEKTNGLIVDYIGVFRRLQAALALYARGRSSGKEPIEEKSELVKLLAQAIEAGSVFCRSCGVDITAIESASGFSLIELADAAVNELLENDDVKNEFLSHSRLVDRLFKAVLPDPRANEYGRARAVFVHLAEKIIGLGEPADISQVVRDVEELLDRSVTANAYVIREARADDPSQHRVDLSRFDFKVLAARFAKAKNKKTEAERLRAAVAAKVSQLAQLNPTRSEWLERFQRLIDDYNTASMNVEEYYNQLLLFTEQLDDEDRRGLAEGLDEEQLAIFDLLMKPGPELTEAEQDQIKITAKLLLVTLKDGKLGLDWRKRQRARASVRLAVEETLDQGLPSSYDEELFNLKCNAVYQHIYDSYWDDERSIYSVRVA